VHATLAVVRASRNRHPDTDRNSGSDNIMVDQPSTLAPHHSRSTNVILLATKRFSINALERSWPPRSVAPERNARRL
jgi:hypothetical protein